jgi:hypothetical protein
MSNSEATSNDFPRRVLALGAELMARAGDCWSMAGPEPALAGEHKDNPYTMGAKRSWVPTLGDIDWEIPKALEDRAYYAYTCQVSDGRRVGYVRVPDYEYDLNAAAVFTDEIIARFESTTDALIFDQVNNNGGSLFQMYALLSGLTDRALALPRHQISITEDDAALAEDGLANAGPGTPPDERPAPELVEYYRFILSEKQAGRGTGKNPTNPVYLNGIAEILPAKHHYTKEIVVLINEVTFSAGEFLAAILQDNKRATLFGQRTAGAGGCARKIVIPNQFRIDYVTVRWTLARRTNGEFIEDMGVQPDVVYDTTVADLRGGHVGYRQALLACLAEPPLRR